MRFIKGPRHSFTETSRKRALVLVRQRKDREKLPLFGALIAEEQPSVDDVMTQRAASWEQNVADQRAKLAADWISARARLNRLPEPMRSAFLLFWNRHRWFPANPGYLNTVLHMVETGRYVLHEGKVRSADDLAWESKRDARIAEMSDAELDHMIQTHISMQFVELGRAERQARTVSA
jgi:hypothetical protein